MGGRTRKSMGSRMRMLAAACVLAVATSVGAQAADRIKVVETARFDQTPAKVWSVVGNFASLSWHPAVKSTIATHGNQRGSQRKIDLGGPVLVEELLRHDGKRHSYSYKILDNGTNQKILPVSGYVSTIRVKPSGDGSLVVWSSNFRAAPGADPASAEQAVRGVYRGGLDNLPKILAQP